ncbi:hypothetical protein [Spiroplasma endosymbiont of Acasis viretata]|uniref:hypothetical protein n=1 Tax=Spiroplasma endosymbiont of Acasis viretata TaxID=3066306 RepID=UPI00313E2699
MSEEDEEEKKKKKKWTKIIAGLIGSAALIGATIAGGMTAIAETEGEKEEEEEKNKKNQMIRSLNNYQLVIINKL